MSHRHKTATLALGLTAPGLIDRRRQQILFSANLHQLDGRFLAADLEQRLDVQTILLHETDALCLGERAFGQARDMDDFALIDATGGLGAAVMSGGKIMTGHSGLAGEIGHITVDPQGRRCGCGNVGCLETVASDLALAGLVSEKIGQSLDLPKALELLRCGEVRADAEIDRTIEFLAIGIAAVGQYLQSVRRARSGPHVRHPRRPLRATAGVGPLSGAGARSSPTAASYGRRAASCKARWRERFIM